MNDKKIALGARAESTGVIVYQDCWEHNNIGFKSEVNPETGEIKSFRIMDNFTERREIDKANTAAIRPIPLLAILLLAAAFTYWSIDVGVTWISSVVCYFIAFVYMSSAWAFKANYKIRFQKDEAETSKAKYHAAVHKVLNAYESLDRVPTLEEASNASMYSANCDSLRFLCKSAFFTILNLIYMLVATDLISPFAMILTLPGIFLFTNNRIKAFHKFERIILLEPGEKELNCAIEAIKEYETYRYWRSE